MAQDDKPGPKLDYHPLASKLRPEDEDLPANTVTLAGYLGPSRNPDSVRLYTDLSFRSYYEIPRAGIRDSQPGPDENSPTRLAVDASTRIDVVQTSRQSVEAGFLSGGITSRFLGAAAAAPAPQPLCITRFTAIPTDCGPVCLTVVTANPTDCGPICLTVVTANPTDCGRGAQAQARAAGQFCLTVVTANPTDCGPRPCITLHTANPTNCGPFCLTVVTANPTDCGLQAGAAQLCPTVFTARPTNCGPQACITLHTANPTNCGPQFCITLHTSVPTYCG